LLRRLIKNGATVYLGENDADKWVIEDVFQGKRDGFFIELGAHNGFDISNTYILEKHYGWRGICIEPDPINFPKLVNERNCICVQACIDGTPREVRFLHDGAIGGIIDSDTDIKPNAAQNLIELAGNQGRLDTVQTKTLGQILRENNAPKVIDFFSFDVEGAETRILRNFDFNEYVFSALVIERASEELNEILFRNGYKFVELRVGDSFYVHQSLPNANSIPKKPFIQVPPKPAPLEINFVKERMSLRSAILGLF
jgi:FkbM family methyltransferase